MFHFYAHKPHFLNNPGTIEVPFLEPFYTAYCNGIRAAADEKGLSGIHIRPPVPFSRIRPLRPSSVRLRRV